MSHADYARKHLVPPTGPHAPAAGDEGGGLSEALAEWLYERSGGIMWRGETYWQDRHREDARQWFAYADMLDLLLAARRPADEQPRTTAQHETEIGAAFLRGYDKGCADGAASILARYPAEPSTPAPEATVVERTPEEKLLHDIFGKPEPTAPSDLRERVTAVLGIERCADVHGGFKYLEPCASCQSWATHVADALLGVLAGEAWNA